MEAMLTLKEVAELEHKEYHAVYRQVKRNKLKAVKVPTDSRQRYEFRIPISELTEKAQARYYSRLQQVERPILEEQETPDRYEQSLNDLTGEQLDEIAFWKRAIESWRSFIADFPKLKTEKTKEFIKIFNSMNPDRAISERTLRHKYKLYKEHGEIALADHRKNRKDRGKTKIDPILQNVFEQWWLDENQPSTAYVYNLVKAWAEIEMPQLLPIPSYDAFYRLTKNIPESVVKYFRYGEKAFTDECAVYIQRMYDNLDSNDIWSADYHTLDMFVRDDLTGKVFRPHVIAWLDVRSRKILSMALCESSNSDGVIIAFRKAAKAWGLPKEVYLDNGREFLVRDFGGRGKRKSDMKVSYGTTMLERLNIKMTNARVRNGRAKVIERSFKQFSQEFSKLYITYTGGSPDKRPERHLEVMKDEKNIPLRSEVEKQLWTYIEGWYNCRESQAEGLNGKSPNECYQDNLIKKRTATAEELDLITLRTSRLQKVKRNGVHLKFGDKTIWFYDTDLVFNYLGHQVYVCYDPEDLSQVIIRDEKERRIGYATMLEVGGYNKAMDKETIKKVKSLETKHRNLVKDYKASIIEEFEAPEALDVLLRKAQQNIESSEHDYDAKIIEVFKENTSIPAAVGDDNIVNFDRMINNAKKRRE